MSGQVIVGYDGSEGARDAVVLGQRLAAAAAREVALVCVSPTARSDEAADGQARERLWETLTSAPVSAAVERQLVDGESVAWGLQREAESRGAAAIVVGSPGHGRSGAILLGSVARRLLHGSPCAVALAPRGYAERAAGDFLRIVVGYTDSDEARAAVRVAAGLGHASGGTVRVVSVVPPPADVAEPRYADAVRVEAQADLDLALRGLANTVTTEGRVLDGEPVQQLLEQADEWADLIVTGSRGYGPVRQVVLGSVSAGLLDLAEVPVIVTPRAAALDLFATPTAVAEA